MSVVVSGLFEPARECCEKVGLREAPHTVERSLGGMGKTDLLPEDDVLQMTTMCGHGMVSSNLVREAIEDVRRGRITIEKAAQRLAEPCICGISKPTHAAHLLRWVAWLLERISQGNGLSKRIRA